MVVGPPDNDRPSMDGGVDVRCSVAFLFHPISHAVRRFHWDTPPSNTVIHVTEKLHAEVITSLQPFTNVAAFHLKFRHLNHDVAGILFSR